MKIECQPTEGIFEYSGPALDLTYGVLIGTKVLQMGNTTFTCVALAPRKVTPYCIKHVLIYYDCLWSMIFCFITYVCVFNVKILFAIHRFTSLNKCEYTFLFSVLQCRERHVFFLLDIIIYIFNYHFTMLYECQLLRISIIGCYSELQRVLKKSYIWMYLRPEL